MYKVGDKSPFLMRDTPTYSCICDDEMYVRARMCVYFKVHVYKFMPMLTSRSSNWRAKNGERLWRFGGGRIERPKTRLHEFRYTDAYVAKREKSHVYRGNVPRMYERTKNNLLFGHLNLRRAVVWSYVVLCFFRLFVLFFFRSFFFSLLIFHSIFFPSSPFFSSLLFSPFSFCMKKKEGRRWTQKSKGTYSWWRRYDLGIYISALPKTLSLTRSYPKGLYLSGVVKKRTRTRKQSS